MNDVSRGRLPRNFVRRSLCDCFSQGNQKLPLVGKLTTPSERQATRRTLVSVESAHALLPSIRVHCLQGIARLNRIESHSGDHKVAKSEQTAKLRYKLFVINELSIASIRRELTGATPGCKWSAGIRPGLSDSTKFLEPRPQGLSRNLRGQGLTSTSEGQQSAPSVARDGQFPDQPNRKCVGVPTYSSPAPIILSKGSWSSYGLRRRSAGVA